ncbi:uncharacterized protein LOC127809649 isoform X1 [Diospyros lotus]|uniref:uncharacterized protein LOC127809649 isoform X1 n=1 Tax=Diospyros lotus TaxID=55363 RepID=UPI0022558278|nr:uncharacterized protein LOC127809649 isoform X1 [Diospyros lotus]
MEKAPKTPPKPPVQPENTHLDSKTPTPDQNSQNSGGGSCISGCGAAPDRLEVPKAFKYPERYRSPTDLMMSPVSRGLLARTRKPGTPLPPTKNQSKEVGLFQQS